MFFFYIIISSANHKPQGYRSKQLFIGSNTPGLYSFIWTVTPLFFWTKHVHASNIFILYVCIWWNISDEIYIYITVYYNKDTISISYKTIIHSTKQVVHGSRIWFDSLLSLTFEVISSSMVLGIIDLVLNFHWWISCVGVGCFKDW